MYPSPQSDDRTSRDALRRLFPPDARPLAYWRSGSAAFLAAAVAGGAVQSIVRLEGLDIRYDGQVHAAKSDAPVSSLDLEGVRSGETVVLFHTEKTLARSALSFDTGRVTAEKLRFILTGIAPGMWEIWRNGWVEDIGVPVRAGEAVLSFEARPGSYFLRRLD